MIRSTRQRFITATILATLALTLVLPAFADINLGSGDTARVAYTSGTGINLRAAGDPDAAVFMVLPEGQALIVQGSVQWAWDGSAWYPVAVPMGTDVWTGWVSADYVTTDTGVIPPPFFDDTTASGATWMVSNAEGLNLREWGSLWAPVIMTLPYGAWVSIVDTRTGDGSGINWSHVSYNGITGYVASDYLGGIAPADSYSTSNYLMVTGTDGDGLNLRAGVGTEYDRVGWLPEGALAENLGGPETAASGMNFWDVATNDQAGWAAADYLSHAAVAGSATGNAIVNRAMQYMGVHYAWGGSTPSGFDCSGFTWYLVSNLVDANYPRAIELQMEYGWWVAASDLQPGDIIFFQNTYQWGLSHVGVYIGGGQFISAGGEHNGVGISSLADPYWAARYLSASRVN